MGRDGEYVVIRTEDEIESEQRLLVRHQRYELQGGEQKTHRVFVAFAEDNVSDVPLAWCHDPLRVHSTPEWSCASEAVPFLVELGVLLDLFVGVFVISIIIHHINREFASLDTRRLSALKE